MRIVAIRHLPTRFNAQGLLQGRRNESILPPDETALRLIDDNRRRLHAMPLFDKILVSRLERTVMTAEAYGYGTLYQVEPLLDELDFGRYEGRPRSEMLSELGEQWLARPQTLVLGEPLSRLGQRAERLLEKYRGLDALLIFGHGAWIRALIALVEHGGIETMNRFAVANNELRDIVAGQI